MPPIGEIVMFVAALAAAGALAGFLAGLFGIGGGAILVPVFFQIFGYLGVDDAVRMQISVGTSLAIIVPTSLRSFFAHKARGAVDMELLKGWIIAISLGALLAAAIAAKVPGDMLRAIFAAIALLIAIRMLFNRESWRLGDDLPPNPVRFVVGVVIGLLSGLMGIGGGVLNNTFMTLFGRPVHQAVATSAGVGVLISIPGLVGFIVGGWGLPNLPPFSTGFINWITVALIIPITFLVAPLGVRLAHGMSRKQLNFGFGIFLIVVSMRFFFSLL
jgi:uncharacterized protein